MLSTSAWGWHVDTALHVVRLVLAEAVAKRTGGQADGVAARAWAGVVIGVGLAAMFAAADDLDADVVELIDAMLGRLEAGFPGSG